MKKQEKKISEHFRFDYDLNSLRKIKIHDFQMWVTPRYLPHYKDSGYESFSTEIINNYLKDNSVFVDVGAHYGYYSILAAKAKKDVEIISVEPVKENFQILKKNLKLNRVSGASIHNLAISNKDGVKEFNVTEASDSAGFYEHPLTKSKKKIKIKTKSLDSLLKNKKIDFIKIDVEGHEISVLSGMSEIIAKNKKLKMLIEFNPKVLKNAGFKPQDLITKVEELDFEVFMIDEHNHRYYRLTDNPYPWDQVIPISNYDSFYVNLFCVRKEESLFTTFFTHTSGLEGAERGLLTILEKLPKHGAISHLISPSQGPLIEELVGEAVAIDVVPFSWWASIKEESEYIDLHSSLISQGKFLETLEKINPHLIYTNTSVIPWGALSALLLKKPHVWHVREFGDRDHQLNYVASLAETRSLINEFSDVIIYTSQVVKKYHSVAKSNKKEIVVPGGIKLKSLSEKNIKNIYKKEKSLKLILVGSFRKSKGQDQAIKAVIDLSEKGYEVELLLLGKYKTEDSYYKKLKYLVKKNKLKNIYFKNFVNNSHLYINQADVLLMCSKAEAFGRVTAEGMLLKKTIVGAKSGATSEIIRDNDTGLLYEEGDFINLSKKIEILIKNPKKMKIIATNGHKESLKKYTSDNYVNKIHGVLVDLKNKSKFPKAINLVKILLQKGQQKNSGKINVDKSQGPVIRKTVVENMEAAEILENIQSAKFFKLWQKYCYYRDKFFKKNK